MTIENCELCQPKKHCESIRIGRGRFEHLPYLDIPQRNLTPIENCQIRIDNEEEQLAKYDYDMQYRLNDLFIGSL